MTTIHLDLAERGYDINIGRGLISSADKLFDLNRRVLIVTDTGVPREYALTVKALCREAKIVTVPEGEGSKSIEGFSLILREMLDFSMTRTDCVVAVGGGVVGDLAGFAAASYMRGVDFYNIPTTLLSQVDSSIGGKTAINLSGVKNIVGAFYQPKGVIIDPDTLKTLPKRQVSNGLAEAIKMSLTSDGELFSLIEECENIDDILEQIIVGSIKIKKAVVECDEREGGIRKILNFGHTLGHGIEAEEEMNGLYHGECVALGMTAVCSESVRARLIPVLKKVGLPTVYEGDLKSALSFISHDKKCDGSKISVIFVDRIGSYRIEKMDASDFGAHVLGELQ
ncbi:MAG: 3-dehydroquinate synthase [Clostridia bacterium]|nr:3-dehydroquinate synthase [Clostridia bacterium]